MSANRGGNEISSIRTFLFVYLLTCVVSQSGMGKQRCTKSPFSRTKGVTHGPGALTAPRSLSEMLTLRPHPGQLSQNL
jgi:hypothetical protein